MENNHFLHFRRTETDVYVKRVCIALCTVTADVRLNVILKSPLTVELQTNIFKNVLIGNRLSGFTILKIEIRVGSLQWDYTNYHSDMYEMTILRTNYSCNNRYLKIYCNLPPPQDTEHPVPFFPQWYRSLEHEEPSPPQTPHSSTLALDPISRLQPTLWKKEKIRYLYYSICAHFHKNIYIIIKIIDTFCAQ